MLFAVGGVSLTKLPAFNIGAHGWGKSGETVSGPAYPGGILKVGFLDGYGLLSITAADQDNEVQAACRTEFVANGGTIPFEAYPMQFAERREDMTAARRGEEFDFRLPPWSLLGL
jgi:hypothetical protein